MASSLASSSVCCCLRASTNVCSASGRDLNPRRCSTESFTSRSPPLHSSFLQHKRNQANKPWAVLQTRIAPVKASRSTQISADSSWEFDPLGIEQSSDMQRQSSTWGWSQQSGGVASSRRSTVTMATKGTAGSIEDSSIDFSDFFRGKLPQKLLQLLGLLALSRLGVYIPLPGVNVDAFQSSLGEGTLLGTLDTLSGGGIGRVGIFSLGIVPYINAQIFFQLLSYLEPKLKDLQRKEGESGRKKFTLYTQYAAVAFAIVQAIGQVVLLKPYATDDNVTWALFSVVALALGAVLVLLIGEKISELKLGNGTSLLIFTNIVSYLPASFGATINQALENGNYGGLAALLAAFTSLVLGIVYVQEAERRIPINYASTYASAGGRGLRGAAYLPFKVNSTGVMPIIFSTSLLAAPSSLGRLTGISFLQDAALFFYPGGAAYLPSNVILIAFFNYYYTLLQLDPTDVSDQLKRQGASIPAVRPGRATATYLKGTLERISVLGSVFLGMMAAAPSLVEGLVGLAAFRGFAGTSILILVGSATDTARKVEAEIVSQKYRNFDLNDFSGGSGPR